jgi:HAD superfamily phosphoserine phosphatase-like hydrolase
MDDPPHARLPDVPPLPMAEDVALIAFDVDGTLVEHDGGDVVWQVLNRRYIGDSSVNAARFQAFLDGRMSYAEWVALDVQGWMQGGATREGIVSAIREELRLVPHASRVVHDLARRGFVVAVVSGTLDIVLDVLFPDHPFAHVFTNRISFGDDGRIAGWNATPYDMNGKADALRMLSSTLGLPTRRIAFIGDHVNDCAAMSLVGCPIAYDPKHDDVRAVASSVLPRGRLDLLLDLLPTCPRS